MSKATKIVLWAIVAAVLVGVMIWMLTYRYGLRSNVFSFAETSIHNMEEYTQHLNEGDFIEKLPQDAQNSARFSKPAARITEVSMNFVAEDIEIITEDTDTITVTEVASGELSEEDIMHYAEKDGVLTVESGRLRQVFGGWGAGYNQRIKIQVIMPADYSGALDVSTVSGDVRIEGLSPKTAGISTVSGDVRMTDASLDALQCSSTSGVIEAYAVSARNVDAQSTSGSIYIEGSVSNLELGNTSGEITVQSDALVTCDADTMSGEIELICTPGAKQWELKASTASGDVRVELPADSEFDLHYSTASGALDNSFATESGEKNAGVVDVSTLSGSLTVRDSL